MKESRLIIFFKRCIAASEYLAIAMTALGRGDPHSHRGDAGYKLKGGGGERTPSLARQIIPKSCSFSPDTEFTRLILDFKSHFSYLHPVVNTLKSHPLLGTGLGR